MRTEDTIKLAQKAFADHELAWNDTATGRWRIRNNEHGFHWAEIICLHNGRLFVGGDIDDCVFAYFGDQRSSNDPTTYYQMMLRWIGCCKDLGYIQEKAQIGMSDSGLLTRIFDKNNARQQIEEWRQEEEAEENSNHNIVYHLSLAISEVSHNNREQMMTELCHAGYWEEAGHVGMITSPRVIYAWQAVRKLCQLLDILEGIKV